MTAKGGPAAKAQAAEEAAEKRKLLSRRILLKTLPKVSVEKPTRPGSAYTLFYKEAFGPTKQRLESTGKFKSVTDCVKQIANEWNAMSTFQRQAYVKKAEEAKAKYEKDYAEYLAKLTPQDYLILKKVSETRKSLGLSTTKPPTDPNKPKKAPTPFVVFVKHFYAQTPTKQKDIIGVPYDKVTPNQRTKLISDAWKSMDDKAKAPFVAEAAKLKKEYDSALAASPVDPKVDAIKKIMKDLVKDARVSVQPKKKRKKTVRAKVIRKPRPVSRVLPKAESARSTARKSSSKPRIRAKATTSTSTKESAAPKVDAASVKKSAASSPAVTKNQKRV
eukprot:jgi/Hompol1/5792/HPOL_004710-RA